MTTQEHHDLREIDGECAYLRQIFSGPEDKHMMAMINLVQIFLHDVRRIANALDRTEDERTLDHK